MPEAQRGKIHSFSEVGFMHQREIPLLPSSGTPTHPRKTAFNAQILLILRLAKYHPFKNFAAPKRERERPSMQEKAVSRIFSFAATVHVREKGGERQHPIQSLLQLCTYTGCVRKKRRVRRREKKVGRRAGCVSSEVPGWIFSPPSFPLLHLS